MLRGMTTMTLWAEDLPAASRWYTELLGVPPYFTSEGVGRGRAPSSSASATTSTSWASSTGDSPPGLPAGPGGAVVYWHVDDVAAALDLLVYGRQATSGVTERGPGFVTAPVSIPSATSWALCTTATTSRS